MSTPTDDAVVLAMLLTGREGLYADEVRAALGRLGFTLSSQRVVGILARLRREDLPMIAGRFGDWDGWEYSVTRWGRTQIGNHYPVLWRDPTMAALPVEPGERER